MAATITRLENRPGGMLGCQGRLAAGERVYIPANYDGAPTTVEVDPDAGATVSVYASLTDAETLLAANTVGVLWNRGAVTAAALDVFAGRVETVIVEAAGAGTAFKVLQ